MISAVGSTVTLIGAAFALFGFVFVGLGAATARSARRFRRRAARARGTIVSLRMRVTSAGASGITSGADSSISPPMLTGGGSGRVYLPTVAFTTAEGREVRAESAVGSNPAPGRVGASVGVLYDPQRPESFRIDTLLGRGGCLPVIFVLIGGVFVAVGVLILSL